MGFFLEGDNHFEANKHSKKEDKKRVASWLSGLVDCIPVRGLGNRFKPVWQDIVNELKIRKAEFQGSLFFPFCYWALNSGS
jgi:hypothetical protein